MLDRSRIEHLIRVSMEEAEAAILRGDDPFGGVITDCTGNIIVRDGNRQNTETDPTAHAEIVLIRKACKKLGSADLSGCISFCNAESCPMCASALVMAGIRTFYFGTYMEPTCNPHIPMAEVLAQSSGAFSLEGGIFEHECREIMLRGRAIRARKT